MAAELPVTERILDSRDLVKGIIYCIEHKDSEQQYVGQTVTHRLNKGKYRPYGVRRRFAEHCSNALCNTKASQSSCLYNAIRQYGRDAFTYHELEVCDLGALNEREQYWINQQGCTYPEGFNLTTGGVSGFQVIATVPTPERGQPGPRGGCVSRSADTRARMSASVKAALSSDAIKAQRSANAVQQHSVGKMARFADVKVDPTNLDQYITIRKGLVLVSVGGQTARFAGKHDTPEMRVAHAREFLRSLTVNHTTATLPNCSGNP